MSLINETVKVYWNFNKKCWSVLHKGRVKMHATNFTLENCTFPVSQSGRQRVLLEKRKNVHAFTKGTLTSYSGLYLQSRNYASYEKPLKIGTSELLDVRYNPYRYSYFYTQLADEIKKVERSDICVGSTYETTNGTSPRLFVTSIT